MLSDLLPGDQVRIRLGSGPWSGKRGTITWASDDHGRRRMYDVVFDELPSSTFAATEVVELSAVSAAATTARSFDNEA